MTDAKSIGGRGPLRRCGFKPRESVMLEGDNFRRYLLDVGLLTDTEARPLVTRLDGGVSCEVVLVQTRRERFVVKQALPRLRVEQVWEADPGRASVEADCLEVYNELLPELSPRIIHRDDANHLYVMEAAPEGSRTWKADLLAGYLDMRVARRLFRGLAHVHGSTAGDARIAQRFADRRFFRQLRIEPYFRATAARHPRIRDAFEDRIRHLERAEISLVHGDFSPKNVLVSDQRTLIVDYEVAHFGDPGFDVAFAFSHLVLKGVYEPRWSGAFRALALEAFDAYGEGLRGLSPDAVAESAVRTLGYLLLARVDGKSPVEYLGDGAKPDAVRRLAYELIEDPSISTVQEALEVAAHWQGRVDRGTESWSMRTRGGGRTAPSAIERLTARQVLDSRGSPTVEVDAVLRSGARGRAIVPSGASRGVYEAIELRDGGAAYGGAGVLTAVGNVNDEISAALRGCDALDQRALDSLLIELDGTRDKSRLGANAVLGTSLAVAWAAAAHEGQPLFERFPGTRRTLPVPMIQIIGGGLHAAGGSDVQDLLVVPLSARSFGQALSMVADVHLAAREVFRSSGRILAVADEGGLWPSFERNEEALELLTEAIVASGHVPGKDIGIALDIAASQLLDQRGNYDLRLDKAWLSPDALLDRLVGWISKYPIVSIEDPFGEFDLAPWQHFTESVGKHVQVVGDDLFATRMDRLSMGIEKRIANSVLVKVNQVGTLTEALDTLEHAQGAGYRPIVSARSGETEDVTIVHLAVGSAAGQIKVGSLTRGERTAKWNELLRIEERLGPQAYHGWPASSEPRN